MRIRCIKPEFWDSESVGRISIPARLLFIGLWSLADDHGRAREHSRFLANRIFTYDNVSDQQIEDYLWELVNENMIVRYESGGSHYLQICNWLNHQKIDKQGKPKYPGPDNIRECSRILAKNSLGSGIRDQGSGTTDHERELSRGSREDSREVVVVDNLEDPFPNLATPEQIERARAKPQTGPDFPMRITFADWRISRPKLGFKPRGEDGDMAHWTKLFDRWTKVDKNKTDVFDLMYETLKSKLEPRQAIWFNQAMDYLESNFDYDQALKESNAST